MGFVIAAAELQLYMVGKKMIEAIKTTGYDDRLVAYQLVAVKAEPSF